MFFTVYQTTNLINQKIYIGTHITDFINDNYLGSGKILKSAIRKHGIENFKKEILFVFDNASDMFTKEKELVNENFINRKNVYNIREGGKGGWDFINNHGLNITAKKGVKNPLIKKYHKEGLYNHIYQSLRLKDFGKIGNSTLAKEKKISTFKKILHQKGEKNSQFGTCWITNGIENKKIKKELLDEWAQKGYYKGRVTR